MKTSVCKEKNVNDYANIVSGKLLTTLTQVKLFFFGKSKKTDKKVTKNTMFSKLRVFT